MTSSSAARELQQQRFEVAGQGQGFRPQRLHTGLREQRQRGAQRRGRKDRRIADGPAGSAGRGGELGSHLEACGRFVAPPAGQPRQIATPVMPLVHEGSADRAGAAVEIFVAAPDRKIGVMVVQRQGYVADGVRQVEARRSRRRHARRARCVADRSIVRCEIALLARAPAPVPARWPRCAARCPRRAALPRRGAARAR